jgi:prephenate dehydrogenase
MNITIIGLGLIGGSMAIDFKHMGHRILGVDANPFHQREAMDLGLVEQCLPLDQAVAQSDVVVVAVPVGATPAVIKEALLHLPANGVIFDVGSTKKGICKELEGYPRRERFVAAHPIAGTEYSGPSAAHSGLFYRKLGIICDREKSATDAVDCVEDLFVQLGMELKRIDSDEHDKHLAYVSHISHLSSFTLGLTVLDIEKDERSIFDMAGSGFASTVRLAKSSPEMWAPIMLENSEHLLEALDSYIDNLNKFKERILNRDEEGLKELMREANRIRGVLEKRS